MTSQRRIEANRHNAQNSTGPRTQAGKERSRRNALKHGLRAEEVVLPTEDAGAFKEHMEAWVADWDPPSMARRDLVERAAVASWRIKRCIRLEGARMSERVEKALEEWDRGEREGVEAEVARLEDDPAGAVEALTASGAGVDRLIDAWDASGPEGWSDYKEHHFRLIWLCGHQAGDREAADLKDLSWGLILRNRPEDAEDGDPEPLSDADAEAACDAIRALAAGKADELGRLRAAMPAVNPRRKRHAELRAYEPRPEDATMFRYEAEQNRVFQKSLDGLIRLAKSGADVAEEAAPIEPNAAEAVAPNEPNAAEVESSGQGAQQTVAPNEPNRPGRVIPVDRIVMAPNGGGGPALRMPAA
jgi:hypothetical protein